MKDPARQAYIKIYGAGIKATIIVFDRVKSKRFTYVYYPVLQFNYHNQSIKFTDKSSIDKDIAKTEFMVYYDPNKIAKLMC